MSRSGSSKRRIKPGLDLAELFEKVVAEAFKDGDAVPILEWVAANRTDVSAIDGLIDAWSMAVKNPEGVEDPSKALWPLAALRGGLSPKHLKRLKDVSSRLLSATSPPIWEEREDDLLRAIIHLILGDVYEERGCLRRYLVGENDFPSAYTANLFMLTGTHNGDLIRNRFLDGEGRLVRGMAGRRLGLVFGVDEDLAARYAGPRDNIKNTSVDLIKESDLRDTPEVAKQDDKTNSAERRPAEREFRPEIDLGRESLKGPFKLAPEERERRIFSEFKPYAKEDPKGAIQFAHRLVREAEAELPPDQNRTLGLRQAARLISEAQGVTLHPTQLRRFFDQKRIDIGELGPDDEPQFSPVECLTVVLPPKAKTGPKPKNQG